MPLLHCPLRPRCSAVVLTRTRLFGHIRHRHSIGEYRNGLLCKVSGCGRCCRTFQSFKTHWFRFHPAVGNVADRHLSSNSIAVESSINSSANMFVNSEIMDTSEVSDLHDEPSIDVTPPFGRPTESNNQVRHENEPEHFSTFETLAKEFGLHVFKN